MLLLPWDVTPLCPLAGGVAAWGWCQVFALKLPVTLNPQKTHPQLAVPSPCWAFMFGGPGKTEESKMNREL